MPLNADGSLPEDRTHKLACRRVKVADCPAKIPLRFIEALEQNQKISSCCRHPENHDIVAYHSPSAERSPSGELAADIYTFICTCGNLHRRVMLGRGERPMWDVR